MGAHYLVVSNVKSKVKQYGKRVGQDFLAVLDAAIDEKLASACQLHNGGKITLDASVAALIFGKKAASR